MKQERDKLLSNVVFNCKLRHYTPAVREWEAETPDAYHYVFDSQSIEVDAGPTKYAYGTVGRYMLVLL